MMAKPIRKDSQLWAICNFNTGFLYVLKSYGGMQKDIKYNMLELVEKLPDRDMIFTKYVFGMEK